MQRFTSLKNWFTRIDTKIQLHYIALVWHSCNFSHEIDLQTGNLADFTIVFDILLNLELEDLFLCSLFLFAIGIINAFFTLLCDLSTHINLVTMEALVQFGPVVSQVMPIIEQSPVYSIARNSSGAE